MAPRAFQTQRVSLRQPAEGDAGAVFEYASDPEVTRFMDWSRLTNQDQVMEFFARCKARWDCGSEYTWLMSDRGNDSVIGAISCRIHVTEADFGYVLNRRHWGRGLTTEAALAVVGWLLSLPQVQRVRATCDAENIRSVRVLEKLGLLREGLVPGGMVRPNISSEPRDSYIYAKQAA